MIVDDAAALPHCCSFGEAQKAVALCLDFLRKAPLLSTV